MFVARSSSIISVTFLLLACVTLTACSGSGSNEPEPGPSDDTTAPSAPGGLAATSGDGEVGLTWDASGASDLDGYNVYRDTEAFSSIGDRSPLNSAPLSETSFTDGDVTNGTTYVYRITAVDTNDNESDLSGEVEVTPFPAPPDRP